MQRHRQADLSADSLKEFPYGVFHPEAETSAPKFKTWNEALQAQKSYNVECPGHRAKKR